LTLKIAQSLFDLVEGSVLELGSHDGSWFTQYLVDRAGSVCCIELDGIALARVREQWPRVRCLQADFHQAVSGVGCYDNVVLFGVLGHTPNPLGLLEDIVHYVKPRRIFLEAEPGGVVRCVREGVNQPGQRQSRRATCGLSIQLGTRIYTDALANLGYKPIRTYRESEGIKQGLEYTVYDLHTTST